MWILDHHFIVCFCSNPQFCLSSFSTLNHHLKQLFLLFTTRTNTYHNHALTQHADTSHAACKTGTWRRSLQSWRTKMRRTFFHMFFVKRTFLGCWWFFYISCSSRNLVEIMYPRKFNENTPNIARYISPPKKMGGGYLLDVFWLVIPTWFGITTFQWSVITMNGDETVHEFTLPTTGGTRWNHPKEDMSYSPWFKWDFGGSTYPLFNRITKLISDFVVPQNVWGTVRWYGSVLAYCWRPMWAAFRQGRRSTRKTWWTKLPRIPRRFAANLCNPTRDIANLCKSHFLFDIFECL